MQKDSMTHAQDSERITPHIINMVNCMPRSHYPQGKLAMHPVNRTLTDWGDTHKRLDRSQKPNARSWPLSNQYKVWAISTPTS